MTQNGHPRSARSHQIPQRGIEIQKLTDSDATIGQVFYFFFPNPQCKSVIRRISSDAVTLSGIQKWTHNRSGSSDPRFTKTGKVDGAAAVSCFVARIAKVESG